MIDENTINGRGEVSNRMSVWHGGQRSDRVGMLVDNVLETEKRRIGGMPEKRATRQCPHNFDGTCRLWHFLIILASLNWFEYSCFGF